MIHVPEHVTNSRLGQDIRKSKGNSIVILKNDAYFTYKKYKRFFLSKTVITTLIVIGLVLYTSRIPFLRAEAVTFYPKACLGGYESVKLAEGKPETTLDASSDDFHKDNSAFLEHDKNADIYCGNFDGEVAENTLPKEVTLTLYLATKTSEKNTAIEVASGVSASSSFLKMLDTAGSSTVTSHDEVIPVVSGDENIIKKDVEQKKEEKPLSSTGVTPTPPEKTETVTPELHTSLSFFLFSALTEKVYAEDEMILPTAQAEIPAVENASVVESPIETKSSETAQTVSESGAVAISPVVSSESNSSSGPETAKDGNGNTSILMSVIDAVLPKNEVAKSSGVATTTSNPQFEVLFSVGNDEWTSLALLGKDNTKTLTLTLPYSPTSWSDLAQVQVQIKSLQTFEQKEDLYIDGMNLSILYESGQKKADERIYSLVDFENSSDYLTLGFHGEKGERKMLDISSKDEAGLALYNLDTESLVMTTKVSAATSTIDPNGVVTDYGSFAMVLTDDPNWCSQKKIEECIIDDTFKGISFFNLFEGGNKKEGKSIGAKKQKIRELLLKNNSPEIVSSTLKTATTTVISTSTLDQNVYSADTLKTGTKIHDRNEQTI